MRQLNRSLRADLICLLPFSVQNLFSAVLLSAVPSPVRKTDDIGSDGHFHLIFYDYCENSRLTLAAEKLRNQLTIFSNLYETRSEPQQRIGQMHRQIFETYKNGDIIKAGDPMKQHLEDSLRYALSCL